MQKLSKIELHRHLEGSLRFSTVVELLIATGHSLPLDLKQQKDQLLVLTPMRDLKSVLDKFWLSQSILSSAEVLERVAFEVCEDAFLEGVQTLELRYAPTFVLENHKNLNWSQVQQSFVQGIERAKKQYGMQAGLIGIVRRTDTATLAQKTMDFFVDHKDTLIGVDLADDEISTPAKNFVAIFAKAQKAGLSITIHAGESRYEGAAQSVKDAIDMLGATRIGHGLQIINDLEIIDYVKQKNITLEICPTSNWLTNAVDSLEVHPIRKLLDMGVRVTINSDDPGIFGIDLSNEYELLKKWHHFSAQDFARCDQYAREATFLL